MKHNKWMILGLGMALMLTMAACSEQEAEETASPTPDPTTTPVQEELVESPAAEPEEGEEEATLTMTASFGDEAGPRWPTPRSALLWMTWRRST